MIDIEQYSLSNGLRVCLNRDVSAPLVAVNIWYHVGSRNEVRGRTGFAHLFEHMLFSGSKNVGNNEHFRYVQSVGGSLNGTTFFDRTNYYETVPSQYLPLALWLEADRMGWLLPALTQEKLDVQKNVVQEERRQRYDNAPYGTWFEELLALAYPSQHPYSWPTIGSMDDIEAATLDDVSEFFQRYYAPSNAVLTVVGDIDLGETRDLIESYFGEIPGGAEIEVEIPDSQTPEPGARKVVPDQVQFPRLYRLYKIEPIGHEQWFTADLLTGLLTSGKSSRLQRSLMIDEPIAQDISAFVMPTETEGMLILSGSPREGVSIEELEDRVDREIARLTIDPITEDELARVLAETRADHAHQIESYESRADAIGMLETFFGDPTMANRWIDSYTEIPLSVIGPGADRIFRSDNMVSVIFEPSGDAA